MVTASKANMAGLAQQRLAVASSIAEATSLRDAAMTSWQMAEQELSGFDASLAAAHAELQSLVETCSEARSRVASDRQAHQALPLDRPLSPEQPAWSILRSTGVLQSYIANENLELDKQAVLPSDASPADRAARSLQATRGAMDKLQGNVDTFSNLYASGVGQTSDEFFASPDQALYVANGGAVYSWAGPNGANVATQVLQQVDWNIAARQLYWALLSREPKPEEQQFVSEQLVAAGDQRPAVVQELVWSILASAEYRLYP
jgi:hypothetical protein